jgi:transketolase
MNLRELDEKANKIRQDIITMLLSAKSGHSAGPLGMADVFTALYFGNVLKYDPKKPNDPDRDRFVLSCGHLAPLLYATMAEAGFFPLAELSSLRRLGSKLQGHPHNLSLQGIENTSGPLGQGLSQAVGMALAAKMDEKSWRVFCVMSDGEQQEGQTWEAAMFAGKNNLNNLTALIDRNNIQISGYTENVMALEPLRAKYEAFGWTVIDVDGHNIREVIDACNKAKAIFENPTLIICHTIPGKGVDFMEGHFEWHGLPPNEQQGEEALKELRTLGGKIRSEHD